MPVVALPATGDAGKSPESKYIVLEVTRAALPSSDVYSSAVCNNKWRHFVIWPKLRCPDKSWTGGFQVQGIMWPNQQNIETKFQWQLRVWKTNRISFNPEDETWITDGQTDFTSFYIFRYRLCVINVWKVQLWAFNVAGNNWNLLATSRKVSDIFAPFQSNLDFLDKFLWRSQISNFTGIRGDTWGQTDGQTDGRTWRDVASGRLSRLCKAPKNCRKSTNDESKKKKQNIRPRIEMGYE